MASVTNIDGELLKGLDAECLLAVLNSEPVIRRVAEIALNVTGALNVRRSHNIDQLDCLAASLASAEYARAHMQQTQRYKDYAELLRVALAKAPVEGLYLEFGVFSGRTINQIAEQLPSRVVWGFDSFEGLPESWRPGFDAGCFRRPDLPTVRENVRLVVGRFDRTLPGFLDEIGEAGVAFLHIDCDLYSSTQTVLGQLRWRFQPGTVIVFDEYFNYPGWQKHEWLAWHEFCGQTGLKYEYIGVVPTHQQVAVRVAG